MSGYFFADNVVCALLAQVPMAVYLGLLSAPDAPGWQAPLRERWYFSDWDVNWLAEQIRPKNESQNVQ